MHQILIPFVSEPNPQGYARVVPLIENRVDGDITRDFVFHVLKYRPRKIQGRSFTPSAICSGQKQDIYLDKYKNCNSIVNQFNR